MRRSLEVRLSAALFIILLGSFVFIRAHALGVAAEQASTCSYCDSSGLEALDITILEGDEKMKAVATALSSQDYKNLKQALLEMGYTPSIDDATAQIIEITVSGTESEVLTVHVPFEGETDLSAGIVFLVSEDHELALSAISDPNEYTLSFTAISFDGEVAEFPVNLGVSAKGDGGVHPLMDQCDSDSDCYYMFGEGWCCVDYQCVICPPPTPPSPEEECELCIWFCIILSSFGCAIGLAAVCTIILWFFGPYWWNWCWTFAGPLITDICPGIGAGEPCSWICTNLGSCP